MHKIILTTSMARTAITNFGEQSCQFQYEVKRIFLYISFATVLKVTMENIHTVDDSTKYSSLPYMNTPVGWLACVAV